MPRYSGFPKAVPGYSCHAIINITSFHSQKYSGLEHNLNRYLTANYKICNTNNEVVDEEKSCKTHKVSEEEKNYSFALCVCFFFPAHINKSFILFLTKYFLQCQLEKHFCLFHFMATSYGVLGAGARREISFKVLLTQTSWTLVCGQKMMNS